MIPPRLRKPAGLYGAIATTLRAFGMIPPREPVRWVTYCRRRQEARGFNDPPRGRIRTGRSESPAAYHRRSVSARVARAAATLTSVLRHVVWPRFTTDWEWSPGSIALAHPFSSGYRLAKCRVSGTDVDVVFRAISVWERRIDNLPPDKPSKNG